MKNKIEISEEEIKKARESANHAANFKFNTAWGPVAIRVVALGQLPPLAQDKTEENDEEGIIPGSDNWIEELYGSLPIEEETPEDFIQTIKNAQKNALPLKLDD